MDFPTLLQRSGANPPPPSLLALDPGETLGWALFLDGRLAESGQLDLKVADPTVPLVAHIRAINPHTIVTEDYRVYPWKLKQHSWSALFTPKLIGSIQLLSTIDGYRLAMQMAASAKGFCTDEKLKEWCYYAVGRHARDAVRHGCFWMLSNKRRKR